VTGRLVAIVGPSGVGKDSVMAALAAADPRLVLARRVITRAAEAGGEIFESVTGADFSRRVAAGDFALHWSAHGLRYGLPATVDATLDAGCDVLANLSRSILSQAGQRFARCEVIRLVAAPEVLEARLLARGRESATAVARRLDRADPGVPPGMKVHDIDNGGQLSATVRAALSALYPANG
jgi:ribose 1,5-bisphosphokinase